MRGAARTLPALLAAGLVVAAAIPPAAVGAAPAKAGPTAKAAAAPSAVLFRGATIWTMSKEGVLRNADVLIRDGKIAKVGPRIDAPAGAIVVDAAGKHLTPGLIDAHSHTAAEGGVNEGSNNVTAEVRILDVLDPDDMNIYRELAGGLTAANVLHGSANSIGGQNAVIKLRWGAPAPELPFREAPPGIKFALGENPKRSNFRRPGPQRYPATRMGVEASIREAFTRAIEYRRLRADYEALAPKDRERREPPRRDLQLEILVEVLAGKRLVHAHCYRQDEILMLIRLADEFGFKIATFQHVLEGYKVADEIAAHGAGASTFSDWWAYKLEAWDAIPYNGALMAKRGVLVSFNSDSDELARRLNLEAAKAIKYGGLGEEEALAFVTINPARQLRIDRWVGSIEPGKDADLALWSGHPLSTYTLCEQTWVDGVKRFDRTEDLARRPSLENGRAALIDEVKNADRPKGPAGGGGAAAEAREPEGGSGASRAGPTAPASPAGAEGPSKAAQVPASPREFRTPPGWATGTLVLAGATVHPVSGPDIPNGTIVIRDGRIVAAGASVPVPQGAEVIRLDGKHVYPGLIDADTVLGLTEIGSVAGSRDDEETGINNAGVRAEVALNPDSELIPVTRANGITHVLTAPRGSLISGTSALIRLDGWTWEDLAASAPAALHVQYPVWRFSEGFGAQRRTRDDAVKEREKALKDLREAFAAARAYRQARLAEGTGGRRPERDPALEAMIPVIEGTLPVIVHAREIRQIRDAVRWEEEEKVRLILAGGDDAWRAADLLAGKRIPVVYGPVLTIPERRDEPYDTSFAAPKRLFDAGVTFCIGGGGGEFNASNIRNLPYNAAMAAAFGLPADEALRSVTLYPARILGLERDLGSIEPGKSASLIVTDGDPLEIRTQVLRVFIDGRPADLTNKHLRLYQRYAARPARPAR